MRQNFMQSETGEAGHEHWLRLEFEPYVKMEIDKAQAFEFYGGNYLSDFDNVTFGGSVSMDAVEKVHGRLEPVWQFVMWSPRNADKDRLLNYLEANPLNGYHVHVFEHVPNRNEVRVFQG